MLPAEWCEMGQQGVRHYLATTTYRVERTAEVNSVPQRYGGGNQGEPARAMLQRLDAPVAQLAEAMEANDSREGIPGLALVKFCCCLSPELRLFQPIQSVEGARYDRSHAMPAPTHSGGGNCRGA